jgi:penicillin-binding protein 2
MNSLSSQNSQSWLSWFLRGTLILLFLILVGKLFEVQVIKGAYYRGLSDQNRIRRIPIPAPRGRILASDGQALADNVAIKKAVVFNPGGSITLSEDLTNATPDQIVTDYKRVYPLGADFAHGSGYLSVVSDSEVGTVDPNCPENGVRTSGMLVGVTGLEEEYQCQLEGIPGEELVEVNTAGREIRILGIKNPISGTDIKTSIDYGLQQEVASDMESSTASKKGAAIITDLNGQILAFYSEPSFDPNLLINKDDSVKVTALLTSPDLPFFDRVVSGTFHPGSVFKPLVAIAALEEGAIDKNYIFNDPGIITVNGFSYTNWYYTEYGKLEGQVNLVKALARSTDTFFYQVGEMVGPVNIAKWADTFDLDKPTGVDIPDEAEGLIPTPDWKQKTIHEAWFLGNTYNMAIGQGDVSVTPIELNTYISAIADNGLLCPPHFLVAESGIINSQFPIFKCKQLQIAQNNLDLVKEGMQDACASGGTAYTFFDFTDKHGGATIACKTGTAEVGTVGIPNAWFTFFTPVDKPQIITTIVYEKGGEGSEVAGPVARKIADYYFQAEASN